MLWEFVGGSEVKLRAWSVQFTPTTSTSDPTSKRIHFLYQIFWSFFEPRSGVLPTSRRRQNDGEVQLQVVLKFTTQTGGFLGVLHTASGNRRLGWLGVRVSVISSSLSCSKLKLQGIFPRCELIRGSWPGLPLEKSSGSLKFLTQSRGS